MPVFSQYTDEQLRAIAKQMAEYPPEKVQRDYAIGKISLNSKMFFLNEYGAAKREIAIRGTQVEKAVAKDATDAKTAEVAKSGGGVMGPVIGEVKFYAQNVIREYKAAWDAATGASNNLRYAKEMTQEQLMQEVKRASTADASKAIYHGMMGSFELLRGFDIPGDVVERWSLEIAPDHPGMARMANWAVWAPTNLLGLQALLKAPFAVAGASMRSAIKGGHAVADFGRYLKDPVAYVVKEAVLSDAVMATKLAKAAAENATRKAAGVAGAAVEAEAKGGVQAFKTAIPNTPAAPAAQAASDFRHGAINSMQSWRMAADEILAATGVSPQAVAAAKAIKAEIPKVHAAIGELEGPGNAIEIAEKVRAHLDELNKHLAAVGQLPPGQATKAHGILSNEAGNTQGLLDNVAKTDWNLGVRFATPQDLEQLTTSELIKHYEGRAIGMIRSKSAGGPGVSTAETKAAAEKAPMSFADIIARGPGAPISDVELASIGNVHDQVLKGYNALLDHAKDHIADIAAGNRPDLVMAFKSHLAAVEISNPHFLSGVGQAGRALRYVSTMQDLVGESRVFDVVTRALSSDKLLEGSDAAIAHTVRQLAELSANERRTMVAMASSDKAYSPGTLRLLYKSLLFARPGIHAANVLGNLTSIGMRGINKTAAAFDPLSKVKMAEANAYWTGMWDSRAKFGEMATKAAAHSNDSLVKAGIETTATGKMVSHGPLGWLGWEDYFMEGVVSHGLAKSLSVKEGLAKWGELQKLVKDGLFTLPSGVTEKSFIADFVDAAMMDPHNYERLSNAVQKEADYIIFHSPLSRGGELVAKAVREGWGGAADYLMPVIKFPINAIKMGRDWTPGLQMLSQDFLGAIAEGGARADVARARMALSWMISSQAYEGAKAGINTGDGPMNPEANAAWRAAGNTPRTIHGMPIQWVEPLATWFAFIADLAHNASEMKEDNLSSAFGALLMSGYQAVENNYFLRIMESVTGSLSDIRRVKDANDIMGAAAKAFGQPVKTLLTGGTVGRVIGEAINPEAPDMKIYDDELGSLKNWFFAGTPFGSDSRPRLNFSGKIQIIPPIVGAETVKSLGAPDWLARGATALVMPSMRPNAPLGEADPVAQIMEKHGVLLHDNWKYYGGTADPDSPLPATSSEPRVSLTGDQAYNWKYLSLNHARQYGTGRTWVEAIQALDADPHFLAKSKNDKQAEFNLVYETFRHDGRRILREKDPEIVIKELDRDQRAAEQRGGARSIFQTMFGSSQSTPAQTQEAESAEQPVDVAPVTEELQ